MNRGFGKILAFTSMCQNFTRKEPGFTTKEGSGRLFLERTLKKNRFSDVVFFDSKVFFVLNLLLSYHSPKFACDSPVVDLRLPVVALFFAYHCPVFNLKDGKRSENERKTALILVLSHFKRVLFEPYAFSNGLCAGLVRVL
ncbi:hypothetical protein [Leptospira kirschneri]|uniref:hypothetical protein n=1 Tax=Leptospira kirschneri TaxID=29507 RepID=UPI0009E53C09|nr:hypothetical protein [Leptospira kirschneri]